MLIINVRRFHLYFVSCPCVFYINAFFFYFAEAELRVLNVREIDEPEVTYTPSSGGSFSLPTENLRSISRGTL